MKRQKKYKTGKTTKPKTDLGKKLFSERKKMSESQLSEWRNWAKRNYQGELTDTTFNYISRGDYISKDHRVFAIKLLQEGRRIVAEFESQLEEIN